MLSLFCVLVEYGGGTGGPSNSGKRGLDPPIEINPPGRARGTKGTKSKPGEGGHHLEKSIGGRREKESESRHAFGSFYGSVEWWMGGLNGGGWVSGRDKEVILVSEVGTYIEKRREWGGEGEIVLRRGDELSGER